MSGPLVRPRQTIESRLRRLEQKLNDELGFRDQRLRFSELRMRNGVTTWELRNSKIDASGDILPQRTAAELAAAHNDDSILFFSYNEKWQPARARDQIEFASSNLRFVVAGVEDMPDLSFRLEWAGAAMEDGAVAYPGVGAAHPHWQFDVDAAWIGHAPQIAQEGAGGNVIEINLENAIENVDFEARTDQPSVAAPWRISATLAAFHRLHLPARSMWHDLLCSMPDVATPQQHTPASEEEIDRWVVSALRYLKSEFQLYM